MSKLYIIIGKSSTGKDTIYKRLLEDDRISLKNVVIYTTRPIRIGEVEGREYHFVDEKRLKEMEKKKKVIEKRSYNTVHGVWNYFTADDGQIDLSSSSYLLIGTLESFYEIKKYYGKENVVPIYIEVEDGLRLERAVIRERTQDSPKYKELCRRFIADTNDFSNENIKKAEIFRTFINDELEACVNEIIEYIKEYEQEIPKIKGW